jgi:hypothetical protein
VPFDGSGVDESFLSICFVPTKHLHGAQLSEQASRDFVGTKQVDSEGGCPGCAEQVLGQSMAEARAEARDAMEMIESKEFVGGKNLKTDMCAWLF